MRNWRAAPVPPAVPARERAPKWTRPVASSLTFSSINVPPEMLGLVGEGAPVPRVSRDQAVSVPAVKRVRDLIAGTLGTLPIREYDMRRRTVPNELLDQPEEDVARSVTMTRTVEDMLFEGRSWWRITEFNGNGFPSKVVRLEPRSVTVREEGRVYTSSTHGAAQGQVWRFVPDAELIRIDSPNDPLLVAGARAIRDCMALARAVTRNVDNPVPLGYFSPATDVDPGDDKEIEEILDDWEDAVARRAWPYLNGSLKANTLAWNPEQLQLGQARDAAILEIARLGGVDPEELGVSTTSRTYANAEQRRLDLLDFTLLAYVTAIETRLSMSDVTMPGHYCRYQYAGFLRSDTTTRLQNYKIGREVGVYNDERIAELEDIPSAKPATSDGAGMSDGMDPRALVEMVQKVYLGVGKVLTVDEARQLLNRAGAGLTIPGPPMTPAPPSTPTPAGRTTQPEESPVTQSTAHSPALTFSASGEPLTIGFALTDMDAEFRVNPEKRTISGLAVPWNVVARSQGSKWMFAPGSLHWADAGRVKMDRDHEYGTEIGRAVRLQNNSRGLDSRFKIARGAEGDRILELAEDGVYDGLSIQADFTAEGDGWTAHPDDDSIRLVHSATLRKVAITAMPAFDDARVASVAATREGNPAMTAPAATPPAAPAPAAPAASPVPPFDVATFTAGLSDAIVKGLGEVLDKLPMPQERKVIPAGRVQVTREAPVYTMNGNGPSMVRDAWRVRTEGDVEARERLAKFKAQTEETAREAELQFAQFAVNTGNASAVVPPGYRPELYVTQLMRGRPLVNSVSRGTLTDATPFTLPSFTSSSNAAADHVEGVNPTAGSLDIDPITVTPQGVSGLFELTREIVDSANPAIDAIAMQAMQEAYSQQTEAKVYAELNGTNGQGGTITSGFVPSGAQAATTTGQGDELVLGIRSALALYPFRRFAAPNRGHLSQEATSALATAVGTDGRPLLPSVGAQNAAGLGNAVEQGWFVDGLALQPTWSLTGNAAGDGDVLIFNSNDIWAWESGLLTFRFEERGGPARIDLALFGYFATRLLRPVGLSSIRHTAA
ncbi:MAG TPA: phage portal protein [Actinophytocola sp.]|uniref:phage portal protein n=1 Tax=Actinophytocola sp. TaxID=1872138 RepID=UPI002DDCAD76|nr:phage portal protein [Actinophytocola sp.]HEV2784689.1 phage portal protein [Actinophytocola sp.]